MGSQSSQQTIQPRIAPLARFVWFLLIICVLSYYSWLVLQMKAQLTPPSAAIVDAMAMLGLAGDAYSLVIILADVALVSSFIIMGTFVFWRHGDNPIVYAVSLTMIGMTVIVTGMVWYIRGASYEVFLRPFDMIMGFIGNGLILLMLYSLPDGHFAPKWTRWGYYMSVAYLALYYASGQSWPLEFNIISRMIVFLSPIFGLQYYRYRHLSSPAQRQQTKWLLFGIVIAALVFFIQGIPAQILFYDTSPTAIFFRFFSVPIRNLLLMVLPLSFAFAALRYRL